MINDDFNVYLKFDRVTAELKDIAKKKGVDLSKIYISDNAELARKEKWKQRQREIWNIN